MESSKEELGLWPARRASLIFNDRGALAHWSAGMPLGDDPYGSHHLTLAVCAVRAD